MRDFFFFFFLAEIVNSAGRETWARGTGHGGELCLRHVRPEVLVAPKGDSQLEGSQRVFRVIMEAQGSISLADPIPRGAFM